MFVDAPSLYKRNKLAKFISRSKCKNIKRSGNSQ